MASCGLGTIILFSCFQPDFLYFVPPLVAFCASHPSVTPAHLECVKFVFVGAAPVGQALIDKFKEKAPHCIFREGNNDFLRLVRSNFTMISR